jgi:hypothetical protein
LEGLRLNMLVYFIAFGLGINTTTIWYILWAVGNLVVIWHILTRFGILSQEISGNPGV